MKKVPSPFEMYVLSEEEQRIGRLLTAANKATIHNLRTFSAMERLELKFDPANPEKFQQAEAELHGRIEVLTLLLDEAEAAETATLLPTNL
jgi:predicted DNA-binding protein with PD1-like motif